MVICLHLPLKCIRVLWYIYLARVLLASPSSPCLRWLQRRPLIRSPSLCWTFSWEVFWVPGRLLSTDSASSSVTFLISGNRTITGQSSVLPPEWGLPSHLIDSQFWLKVRRAGWSTDLLRVGPWSGDHGTRVRVSQQGAVPTLSTAPAAR